MGDSSRWPGGQLARYLTAGGTTVDVAPGLGDAIEVDCLGCPHHETVHQFGSVSEDPAGRNLNVARRRAEAHAERCRAMAPPPE